MGRIYAPRMARRAPLLRRIVVALVVGTFTTIALAWLAMFLPRGHAWNGPRQDQELGVWTDDGSKIWSISRGDNAWHGTVGYWHMQARTVADDSERGL